MSPDDSNNDSDNDSDDVSHLDGGHFHVGGHGLPSLLGHVARQVWLILKLDQCQY